MTSEAYERPDDASLELLESGASDKEEDTYEHVGLVHLEAIGGASASLGLISTLVFSICLGSVLQKDIKGLAKTPLVMLYLAVSTSMSAYTTCFSLLEYYYAQMFKGVDSFISKRLTERGARSSPTNIAVNKERAQLVKNVRAIFSTFNAKRGAARNSMWLGLLCLILSMMAHLDTWSEIAPGIELTSSMISTLFFASVLALVGPAWYNFRTPDMAIYTAFSAVGFIACLGESCLIQSKFPTSKLVAFLILLGGLLSVPLTVLAFRRPLLAEVKKYVDVY